MGFEKKSQKGIDRQRIPAAEKITPEDIADELSEEPELLKYLRLLPRTLWVKHFETLEHIEREHSTEGQEAINERRINYILGIVQARERAIVEFDSHEPFFRGTFSSERDTGQFGKALHELLISMGSTLGSGQTARVKSMNVPGIDTPIAVKYLLTPTHKTLSAQGEHDLLYEVETMTEVEDHEKQLGAGTNIRVPHPFFFYKRGSLQCYGMTQVNGVGLDKIIQGDGGYDPVRDETMQALRRRFAVGEARKALHEEVDVFMQAVHEVCRHGDIKLANVMVDTSGTLYLIDFGQSLSVRTMSEKTRDQFENLATLERDQMQEIIRQLWNHV